MKKKKKKNKPHLQKHPEHNKKKQGEGPEQSVSKYTTNKS